MNFNSAQLEAIHTDTDLLVIAPPGSGKTGLLIAKAIHILESEPDSRVGMLTFTKEATNELIERLKHRLAPTVMRNRVVVATFHGMCQDLLRTQNRLGSVVYPNEGPTLLRQAMSNSQYIGLYEDALVELESHKRNIGFTGLETPLVSAYQAILRRHRKVDLNDVVREAAKGLKEGTLHPLNVTHLLGDEIQDSDVIQLMFMYAHSRAGIPVTIVGDDDQSIYSFRGSQGYEGMVKFEQKVSAKRVVLDINYRSHEEILFAAGALIKNNTARVEKMVVAAKGPGGQVHIKRVPSRGLECKVVADMIRADVLPSENGEIVAPSGRWAVIARTNNAFRMLIGELKSSGIAYQRLGGRDEIPEDALAFMSFLNTLQTGDSVGLEMMLGKCHIHHTAAAGVINYFGNECYRYLDGEIPELDRPLPEDEKLIAELARRCATWRNLLADGHYDKVIDGVADWFISNNLVKSKRPDEDFSFWVSLLMRSTGSLTKRTDRLLRPRNKQAEGGVTLTTMHTSKGLEFDRVIIIEANVGVTPSSKAESVEEERRLFFVAMTRAKIRLDIMFQPSPGPSSFIAEIERGTQGRVVTTMAS